LTQTDEKLCVNYAENLQGNC